MRADRASAQRRETGGNRREWSECCGFIFYSSDSTYRTQRSGEALYDSAVIRQFAGIELGSEPVPDETAVYKFRHLLGQHELGERLFGMKAHLGVDSQTKLIHSVVPTAANAVDGTVLPHRRYRHKDRIDEVERPKNPTKSRVRSKVEHVFAVPKLPFGFLKDLPRL